MIGKAFLVCFSIGAKNFSNIACTSFSIEGLGIYKTLWIKSKWNFILVESTNGKMENTQKKLT